MSIFLREFNVIACFSLSPDPLLEINRHRLIFLGIPARILPGISAEDCLVADLNIDPSLPGMQTLEATDYLLRRRTLMTDLHVVIWQVGCVGDTGFNFKGYKNENFSLLIDSLQKVYGENYVIVHYICNQFPICRSRVDRIPLSDFHKPEIAKEVTGVSTFYIPPAFARPVDPALAVKFGLVANEKEAEKLTTGKRVIDRYGPREKTALKELGSWKLPEEYKFTPDTPGADALVKMSQNVQLLRDYEKNPDEFLEKLNLPGYQARAFRSRHPGAIRLALKPSDESIATQAALKLLVDPTLSGEFIDEIKKAQVDSGGFDEKLSRWWASKGYATSPKSIEAAVKRLESDSLVAWTGHYNASQKHLSIVIKGAPPPSKGQIVYSSDSIVFIVTRFTFKDGRLSWTSAPGDLTEASLQLSRNEKTLSSSFKGTATYKGKKISLTGTTVASESPLSIWEGRYQTTYLAPQNGNGPEVLLELKESTHSDQSSGENDLVLSVAGKRIVDYVYEDGKISWTDRKNLSNGNMRFFKSEPTSKAESDVTVSSFSAYYWPKSKAKPTKENLSGKMDPEYVRPFLGKYKTFTTSDEPNAKAQPGPEMTISLSHGKIEVTLGYGKPPLKNVSFNNPVLSWAEKDGNPSSGTVSLNLHPSFVGTITTGHTQKKFIGTADKAFIAPFAGFYTVQTRDSSGQFTVPAPALFIQNTGTDSSSVVVSYGGVPVPNAAFNNPVLSWPADTNGLPNASLLLYIPKDKRTPRLAGKVWAASESEPAQTNAIGLVSADYLSTWNGIYYTLEKDHKRKYTIEGENVTVTSSLDSPQSAQVKYFSTELKRFSYANNVLTWKSSDGNPNSGAIRFYRSKSNNVPGFAGDLETGGSPASTTVTNWIGSVDKVEIPDEKAGSSVDWGKLVVSAVVNAAIFAMVNKALDYFLKKAAAYLAKKTAAKNPSEENKEKAKEAEEESDKAEDEVNDLRENVEEETSTESLETDSPDGPTTTTETTETTETETTETETTETETTETETTETETTETETTETETTEIETTETETDIIDIAAVYQ